MPRQQLIFLKGWSKPSFAMKADPVPCAEEPSRIWTLFNETDESRPPALPIVPVHRVNAFAEDYVHDWNWHKIKGGPALLYYFSRVVDRPVWILLEFDTAEDIAAREARRSAIRAQVKGMKPGSIGSLDATPEDLEACGFSKVEPRK